MELKPEVAAQVQKSVLEALRGAIAMQLDLIPDHSIDTPAKRVLIELRAIEHALKILFGVEEPRRGRRSNV